VNPDVEQWQRRGQRHLVAGQEIFVVDIPASLGEHHEPLLVIHGYPTSSYDFAGVAPLLARERRVVLVDLLGYGLSAKPDQPYTMALQADVVAGVAATLGLHEVALLTHDMGDTVGGELLARHMEGGWPLTVTRRVLTNGSIYIAMANLTAGQNFLLSLPDALIDPAAAPRRDELAAALQATLAKRHADIDMSAHAELIERLAGNRLLARTIRYIEERRSNERRFTGAIESHPSPLSIVWGPEDPIAVAAIAERLKQVRPDATLRWIEGAGHYPQIEELEAFTAAVTAALSD
jgi:pimeloyl-ACP methyl ester carboxylesterase